MLPHRYAVLYTAVRMQQFLYFLPLPQGQGSLRPTFAVRLRIGSFGLALCWLLAMACCCSARMPWEGMGAGADSWTVAPICQRASANDSAASSMRKTRSVTFPWTLSHMESNIRMPWRLYSVFGSTWA